MSEAPRYRVFLKKGERLDVRNVEWLPGRLRVVQDQHRHEVDEESGDARKLPDGVRVREYPAGAVTFVEDLQPPEGEQ